MLKKLVFGIAAAWFYRYWTKPKPASVPPIVPDVPLSDVDRQD